MLAQNLSWKFAQIYTFISTLSILSPFYLSNAQNKLSNPILNQHSLFYSEKIYIFYFLPF